MQLGISVVICTHNGALRLPQTLRHLAAQRVRPDRPWELLVVDNASADNTPGVVRQAWPEPGPAPLRIVAEPRVGLGHARRRGLAAAEQPLIAFVDDDNWLAPDWVETAASVMEDHPEAGALGGFSEAAFEAPPPSWLEPFKTLLAIGPAGVAGGDVTEWPGLLWGAGLVVRKQAWLRLERAGFQPALVGRAGAALSTGEDTELCLALRLAGWRLWYAPGLRLRHYMPAGRLTWTYLRRLHRTNGAATVHHDPYYFALRRQAPDRLAPLRRRWWWQVVASLKAIAGEPRALVRYLAGPSEGDALAIQLDTRLARLGALLRLRGRYDRGVRRALSIPWHDARPDSST
jgi:glycosyltransferase involved in cell wall biosynthesis